MRLSVCQSMCVTVSVGNDRESPAKAAKPIEMPFGVRALARPRKSADYPLDFDGLHNSTPL